MTSKFFKSLSDKLKSSMKVEENWESDGSNEEYQKISVASAEVTHERCRGQIDSLEMLVQGVQKDLAAANSELGQLRAISEVDKIKIASLEDSLRQNVARTPINITFKKDARQSARTDSDGLVQKVLTLARYETRPTLAESQVPPDIEKILKLKASIHELEESLEEKNRIIDELLTHIDIFDKRTSDTYRNLHKPIIELASCTSEEKTLLLNYFLAQN